MNFAVLENYVQIFGTLPKNLDLYLLPEFASSTRTHRYASVSTVSSEPL